MLLVGNLFSYYFKYIKERKKISLWTHVKASIIITIGIIIIISVFLISHLTLLLVTVHLKWFL